MFPFMAIDEDLEMNAQAHTQTHAHPQAHAHATGNVEMKNTRPSTRKAFEEPDEHDEYDEEEGSFLYNDSNDSYDSDMHSKSANRRIRFK